MRYYPEHILVILKSMYERGLPMDSIREKVGMTECALREIVTSHRWRRRCPADKSAASTIREHIKGGRSIKEVVAMGFKYDMVRTQWHNVLRENEKAETPAGARRRSKLDSTGKATPPRVTDYHRAVQVWGAAGSDSQGDRGPSPDCPQDFVSVWDPPSVSTAKGRRGRALSRGAKPEGNSGAAPDEDQQRPQYPGCLRIAGSEAG